jgi:hypothetical protein
MENGKVVGVRLVIGVVFFLGACALKAEPVEGGVLNLTFTGDSCVYEGPELLKIGEATLHFNNQGEMPAAVNFGRLIGGKTIKDVIDDFGGGDEPVAGHANPEEVEEPGTWEFIQSGEDFTREGYLIPGEYVMVCGRVTGCVWFGAGLEVVEE